MATHYTRDGWGTGMRKRLIECIHKGCGHIRYDFVIITFSCLYLFSTKPPNWGGLIFISLSIFGHYVNKYMSLKVDIKDKLKGTFVSLVNCGIVHEHVLHTLSCQKIYKCIVLPKVLYFCKKALYVCKTWYNTAESDILSLERAHRFCIKHMQGLNIQTRTDIALTIMAMYTIESEKVFRKLTILGQPCRLNIDHWLRIVFLNRLYSFDANNMK